MLGEAEQVTFSLMGQEGTKGDFEACGVCGRRTLNASKRVFDLGLYLCASGVFSLVSKERLFFLLCCFRLFIKLHV